jgi:hypothetical protein
MTIPTDFCRSCYLHIFGKVETRDEKWTPGKIYCPGCVHDVHVDAEGVQMAAVWPLSVQGVDMSFFELLQERNNGRTERSAGSANADAVPDCKSSGDEGSTRDVLPTAADLLTEELVDCGVVRWTP